MEVVELQPVDSPPALDEYDLVEPAHSKVPISVHPHQCIRDGQAGAMYEFICEFAALEPPPELQHLLRTVHGNQAAMDGFGEYRSGSLLRASSQSTLEAVLNQEAAATVR